MKIIILGADQVGAAVASYLVRNDNEITVVDTRAELLNPLQERFDLRVVQGYGAYPRVLREAGIEDADMLVAVTCSDETNLVACQVAHALFKKPHRIARIRSPEYLSVQTELFGPETIPVDQIIMPEQLVTDYLHCLIEHPGALYVLSFCQNKVGFISFKVVDDSPLVGMSLLLAQQKVHSEARIVALYRQNRPLSLLDNTLLEAGDEMLLIAAFQHLNQVKSQLHCSEKPYKQLMIVGGGNIGAGLAKKLAKKYSVKLIERDAMRAQALAVQLSEAMVFRGDAADQALLLEEHIEQVDLFIAVTDDDEDNIMSAMLAKHLGAKKNIVLIQRSAYVELLQGNIIDCAISPQQITLSALLTYLRKGDIVNVFSLRGGEAEAIEIMVRGDLSTSQVIGRTIGTVEWPTGVTLGALVRKEEVMIAHDELVIETNDHLLLFLMDCKQITQVDRLLCSDPTHSVSKYNFVGL